MRVALMLLSLLSLPVLAAVQVIDPYVRVLPPGSPNTAAFMQLTNAGTNELALVAVETDLYGVDPVPADEVAARLGPTPPGTVVLV